MLWVHGNIFTKINLKIPMSEDKELEKMDDKLKRLESLKNDIINDNYQLISRVL